MQENNSELYQAFFMLSDPISFEVDSSSLLTSLLSTGELPLVGVDRAIVWVLHLSALLSSRISTFPTPSSCLQPLPLLHSLRAHWLCCSFRAPNLFCSSGCWLSFLLRLCGPSLMPLFSSSCPPAMTWFSLQSPGGIVSHSCCSPSPAQLFVHGMPCSLLGDILLAHLAGLSNSPVFETFLCWLSSPVPADCPPPGFAMLHFLPGAHSLSSPVLCQIVCCKVLRRPVTSQKPWWPSSRRATSLSQFPGSQGTA